LSRASMGSRYPRAAGSPRSHCGVRLVGLQVQDAPFLLQEAAIVQGVSAESARERQVKRQKSKGKWQM
jgi:hypothetical protein